MSRRTSTTLKEVARKANVSPGTVSNTYSGNQPVAKKTRERVLRVARELGYSAYGPGSALRARKSGLIGILPGSIGAPALDMWESTLVKGFCDGLSHAPYNAVILTRESAFDVPRILAGRWVDGVAFLIDPDKKVLDWTVERSIPCVMIDAQVHDGAASGHDNVCPDDAEGVREALAHLVSLGHRRIAYLNRPWPRGHALSIKTRLDSFQRGIHALGIDAPPGSELQVSVEERMHSLSRSAPPTAFLCYNDNVALETLQSLYVRGVRVPQDVSVVGIDDLEYAGLAAPPLSSVHLPFDEMGRRAAELLLRRIAEPDRPFENVKLPETLVVRHSSGAAPTNTDQRHGWRHILDSGSD